MSPPLLRTAPRRSTGRDVTLPVRSATVRQRLRESRHGLLADALTCRVRANLSRTALRMNALKDLWRRNPAACAALMIACWSCCPRLPWSSPRRSRSGRTRPSTGAGRETLDFGYYSKPPLIAWVIAASTAVFGDGEWAIRFFSPVLHGVAAFFLFLLGKRAFDARIGAWSAAIYLLMPGVWLSSTIMSTDAVLLPAWSAALYFLWRFRDGPSTGQRRLRRRRHRPCHARQVCGALSLCRRRARRAHRQGHAQGRALACWRRCCSSPRSSCSGPTSGGTSPTTSRPSATRPTTPISARQASTPSTSSATSRTRPPCSGPLTLLLLFAGFAFLVRRKDKWTTTREIWLMASSCPPLVVIMGQEIMSRAHANWAAAAYPAACVLVASWIDRAFGGRGQPAQGRARPEGRHWRSTSLIGAAFTVFWVVPTLADATGVSAGMKGVRGWKETVAELAPSAHRDRRLRNYRRRSRDSGTASTIMAGTPTMPPIRAWQRGDHAAQPRRRGRQHAAGRGHAMSSSPAGTDWLPPMIRADFASIRELGYLDIPLGPKRERKLKLYRGLRL